MCRLYKDVMLEDVECWALYVCTKVKNNWLEELEVDYYCAEVDDGIPVVSLGGKGT